MADSRKVSIILPPVWYVYKIKMICGSRATQLTASGMSTGGRNKAAVLTPAVYFRAVNIFKLQAK